VVASFVLRLADATKEALIPVPAHTTNGDETLYADKSGTYTKVLLQDSFGKVDLNAYNSMKNAFATGNPSDFENIILGGTRTLNGLQGSLAFGLQGTDAVQFGNATSPANQENSLAIVLLRRRSPAPLTERSWWKCTGRRCCAMWPSRIIRPTPPPSRQQRN